MVGLQRGISEVLYGTSVNLLLLNSTHCSIVEERITLSTFFTPQFLKHCYTQSIQLKHYYMQIHKELTKEV
jgi:hypothetical protein